MRVKIIVIGENKEGNASTFPIIGETSQSVIDKGLHLDAAIKYAEDKGFTSFMALDEKDTEIFHPLSKLVSWNRITPVIIDTLNLFPFSLE